MLHPATGGHDTSYRTLHITSAQPSVKPAFGFQASFRDALPVDTDLTRQQYWRAILSSPFGTVFQEEPTLSLSV
jgi:hypothetical protein